MRIQHTAWKCICLFHVLHANEDQKVCFPCLNLQDYYYYYYYYYYYLPHQQFLAFLTITVRPATFWWKIETCVSLCTESALVTVSVLGKCTVKNYLNAPYCWWYRFLIYMKQVSFDIPWRQFSWLGHQSYFSAM